MFSMKKALPFVIVAAISILVTAVSLALYPTNTKSVQASAFDHSVCQYPFRTTNPADGCDNSDPANPLCAVKGLPEDCTEGFDKDPTPPNPYRNYYDAQGNEYKYDGTLLHSVTPTPTTPSKPSCTQ